MPLAALEELYVESGGFARQCCRPSVNHWWKADRKAKRAKQKGDAAIEHYAARYRAAVIGTGVSAWIVELVEARFPARLSGTYRCDPQTTSYRRDLIAQATYEQLYYQLPSIALDRNGSVAAFAAMFEERVELLADVFCDVMMLRFADLPEKQQRGLLEAYPRKLGVAMMAIEGLRKKYQRLFISLVRDADAATDRRAWWPPTAWPAHAP